MAEVVPVSSSAQLVLLPWLLGWPPARDRTTFAAGLHAGSCLGIAWAVRRELLGLDRRTVLLVAGASVPAAVAGALAADAVEERLGRPPQLAALLAAAGLVMWAVDARAERAEQGEGRPGEAGRRPGQARRQPGQAGRRPGQQGGAPVAASVPSHGHPDADPAHSIADRSPRGGPSAPPAVGPREAAWAGAAQVAALMPGVSRSGATLTALRAAGVPRVEAERFSLLMSLPVTAGAALLTLARTGRADLRGRAGELAPGAITAALAGALAAGWRSARPGAPLRGPALYRLGLGTAVVLRLRSRRVGP